MSGEPGHGAQRRGTAGVGDPDPLIARAGLPDDLLFLLRKYPRHAWGGTHPIGVLGRFWLKRHDMFRELGATLCAQAGNLREAGAAGENFTTWFAPRLSFFLNELNAHHMIEDEHYFPALAAAEPKLQRGFELLDQDHHLIHQCLESNALAARAFLDAIRHGGDRLKRASEHYGSDSGRLVAGLMRHLADEEDLIVPLLIERGEDAFGPV